MRRRAGRPRTKREEPPLAATPARKRLIAATLLSTVVVSGLLADAASGARTSSSIALSPTVNLRAIRLSTGPQEIRILKLAPGSVPDIGTGGKAFPLRLRTSAISAAAGALAGVNGDFGTNDGRPAHTLMVDGELWTTGVTPGNAIAWAADGSRAFIGAPDVQIKATVGKKSFPIQAWNAPVSATGVSGYTARGGSKAPPPGVSAPAPTDPSWCAARLEPSSAPAWNPSRTTIVRRYRVVDQPEPCPQTRMAVGSTSGAVVLASQFAAGTTNHVLALSVGDRMKIATKPTGWPGVEDIMGGVQILVDGGVNVAPPYYKGAPHILDNNPRTAAGITQGCADVDPATSCTIILITVDGRQVNTGWSKGVRLISLANELIRAGAWQAVNLDGGGSTTMWARDTNPLCQSYPLAGGCLVQRPSQSTGERSRPSAIVVLPGPDPGTPAGLR